MRVAGLDICKASVAAVVLDSLPDNPRLFYRKCRFEKLEANATGIKRLIDLGVQVAAFEPTGVNYARIWGYHLALAGVEIRMVGHSQLRSYRKHLGLPDKNDNADALALACYAIEHDCDPSRFVRVRSPVIVEMRRLVLRLEHLNRVQSPIINQARQHLAWQLPEAALVKSRRSEAVGATDDLPPLLWGWLAGLRASTKYDRLATASCGMGLREDVRSHAERICHLQAEEARVERQIRGLVDAPEFSGYRRVFQEFGFGQRVEALLLTQIYPLADFLGIDGRPIVERTGQNRSPKYRSLARFKNSLGLALVEQSSGDKERHAVGGAALARKSLWQWAYTRIEPARSRVDTAVGAHLGRYIDEAKTSGVPARLARSRTCVRASRLLFDRLVAEIPG